MKTDCRTPATARPLALITLSVAAALFVAFGDAAAQPPTVSQYTGSYAPGRILAMPRAGLADDAIDRIVRENGGTKARRVGQSQLRIIDVPPGLEGKMVERLGKHPHFKFAELDVILPGAMIPNDPYFGSQWHHAKIGSQTAWESATGTGVVVAVLDTGVDSTHPELSSRLVPGWNFFANNSDTRDTRGHGTAVAGTVAAATNNGVGVASIAGNAKIMPIRISDDNGNATASAVAQAITYAADNGARVANVSFENLPISTSVQSAAQYMKNKNGLVVVAAGNTGTNTNWAATSTMIPVSATGSTDQLTSFTSWGPYVAMSAPGIDIWTTKAGGTYWYCWGTSFASPVTAGVVALMMSANPALSAADVERLLYATATDLGLAGRDPQFGHGRVNAAAAVLAARNSVPAIADTTPPSASISTPLGSASVSGLVAVNATASDNVGVAKVELRVNGSLVATDTASPYAFSWDSTKLANGMATLTAIAYDAAGNSATSIPVAVSVANPVVADTTPPSVTITSPSNGAKLKARGSVTITSSASDNSGLAGLKQALYINGRLLTTTSGGSISYNWSVNKVSAGSHSIKVVATDAAGNSSSSTITVSK